MTEDLVIFLFISVIIIVVFSFIGVVVWSISRRREREAYYKSETIKKIAEQGTGAASALEFLREEEKKTARRRIEGLRLGSLITVAVGAALMIFLRAIERTEPVYLQGLIPLFVGVVLIVYSYFLAPKP